MVARVRIRFVATWIMAFTMGLAACNSDGPLVRARTEPFLYLVLNQRASGLDTSIDQRALLLTLGSPAASDYRVAQRFEMRRLVDGAVFQWSDLGRRGQAPVDESNAALLNGNYALPASGSGGALGANDLVMGERYGITVETDGVTITGAATIPPAFTLTLTSSASRRSVVWAPVPGAALYSVEVLGVTAPAFQPDTVLVLPALPPQGADVVVRALDDNLATYVSDKRVTRRGIDNGYGVFGAMSVARIHVSP